VLAREDRPVNAPIAHKPGENDRPLLSTPWAHLYIREGFEPHETWSASQLSTAEDCEFAWGLRYLVGLRTAEPKFDGPESLARLNKRDYTLAFGKAIHSVLEAHFKGEPVDWASELGQRALVGLHYLPVAPPVRVEAPIQLDLNECLAGFEPLSFVGYVDLDQDDPTARTQAEAEERDITLDYKSTGNFRWMKKPADLQQDLAANLYLFSGMQRRGTSRRRGRWVYFMREGKPEARPVDFTIYRQAAQGVIASAMVQAAGLRAKMREYVALPDAQYPAIAALDTIGLRRNPATCPKYNGCPYHFSTGGPCTAEATPGQQLFPLESLARVSEPKQTNNDNPPDQPAITGAQPMATLAERLAAGANQQAQPQAPAAPQQPAGFNPMAFPPPGGAPAFPAVAPPPAQAFAQPPPGAVVGQAPAFPGFGAPPGQAPVFAGVNPPEQATAAPLPPAQPQQPAAPQAPPASPFAQQPAGAPEAPKNRGGRPRKNPAGTPAPATVAAFAAVDAHTTSAPDTQVGTVATGPGGLCSVSIVVTHENGATLIVPAPVPLAEQFAAALGDVLAGMI
jgi:hypothetical protein